MGITDAQVRKIRQMGAADWRHTLIAYKVGVSIDTVKCYLVPGYRENRQEGVNKRRSEKRRARPRPGSRAYLTSEDGTMIGRQAAGLIEEHTRRPPPSVLAERDRLALIDKTPNQALLGDPLPGRSALDKRRQHNGA